MNVGDRVYVLIGLDVEEWEVYCVRNDELASHKGPWIKREGRFGCAASHYRGRIYTTLDDAVTASRAARERTLKSLARQIVSLGINTNVKVRLMKKPARPPAVHTEGKS